MASPARLREALRALAEHGVEHIVVGGVAAVLEGAPISTFDLDLVYQRSRENVERLLAALAALDASYRDPAGRVMRPAAEALERGGHHLLFTSAGPLDLLGTIGSDQGYEELLPRSRPFDLGGLEVRVLELAAVIETKEQTGREKDRSVLPVLRETLRLRNEPSV